MSERVTKLLDRSDPATMTSRPSALVRAAPSTAERSSRAVGDRSVLDDS